MTDGKTVITVGKTESQSVTKIQKKQKNFLIIDGETVYRVGKTETTSVYA